MFSRVHNLLPSTQVHCNCKASAFGYPPPVTEEVNTAVSKVPTAVLSTTVRARDRAAKRRADKHSATGGAAPPSASKIGGTGGRKGATGGSSPSKPAASKDAAGATAMDTDEADTSAAAAAGGEASKAAAGEAAKAPEAKDEPSTYVLETPARVVPAQEQYIAFDVDERWRPLKAASRSFGSGVVMLFDTKPGEPEEPEANNAAQPSAAPAPADLGAAAATDELPPPEPFEYSPE
ncbi:hypothetical protein WJX73_010254, partial [Symbiochloris irregularis]